MKIVTLCENRVEPSFKLKASHGLSLYIEYKNHRYLYDVGQDQTYLENAKTLDIDLTVCEKVIISHGHFDHIGGLCYYPNQLTEQNLIIDQRAFQERVRIAGKKELDIGTPKNLLTLKDEARIIHSDFKIAEDVWVLCSGNIQSNFISMEKGLFVKTHNHELQKDPFEDELSLAFRIDKGLVVISGCSHRGVIHILKHAQKVTGVSEIYAFIGGLHLAFATEEERNNIIEKLQTFHIQEFVIGHCTGLDACFQLKQVLSPESRIINNYVGYQHKFEER